MAQQGSNPGKSGKSSQQQQQANRAKQDRNMKSSRGDRHPAGTDPSRRSGSIQKQGGR